MFNSKFVKIEKTQWEQIKDDYNILLARNKALEETQSEFLMGIVEKQSDEISKLMKYQENDDLLYSYEQSYKEQSKKVKSLEDEVAELKIINAQLQQSYNKESTMTTLLARKIIDTDCPKYETVSKLDIHA